MRYGGLRGVLAVERFGEDAHFGSRMGVGEWVGGSVDGILGGEKHGAKIISNYAGLSSGAHLPSGEHDGRVVREPLMVKGWKGVDCIFHERRSLRREDEVVGHADLHIDQLLITPAESLTHWLGYR